MLLSMVHAREILLGKREGRGDTSQAQNWSNFRNASVDKASKQASNTTNVNKISHKTGVLLENWLSFLRVQWLLDSGSSIDTGATIYLVNTPVWG